MVKDYNRNIFHIRTDDKLAAQIRNYCKENDVPPNQFFKIVLRDYFDKKDN
tara:strand:+ start:6995 stop:7147 length:153 start_codon:yes stop_codon:yes gene_type:complete